MTEEEIEKKTEEYAKQKEKITGSYPYGIKTAYKDGYEQGQKESEEQIQIDIEWIDKLEKENEELKAQIEKMKSEINTVYLAFVYVNDCLADVLSFGTLEKAEEYKKSKDSFNPCCVSSIYLELCKNWELA